MLRPPPSSLGASPPSPSFFSEVLALYIDSSLPRSVSELGHVLSLVGGYPPDDIAVGASVHSSTPTHRRSTQERSGRAYPHIRPCIASCSPAPAPPRASPLVAQIRRRLPVREHLRTAGAPRSRARPPRQGGPVQVGRRRALGHGSQPQARRLLPLSEGRQRSAAARGAMGDRSGLERVMEGRNGDIAASAPEGTVRSARESRADRTTSHVKQGGCVVWTREMRSGVPSWLP